MSQYVTMHLPVIDFQEHGRHTSREDIISGDALVLQELTGLGNPIPDAPELLEQDSTS